MKNEDDGDGGGTDEKRRNRAGGYRCEEGNAATRA